mmetsp:Transcript_2997/g.4333  ORF Transcript_2997/g.4333 Transcript_2997/m.4333 type:complete len:255 (+) Transcript_2997:258-1022(+)|eukprot:CAMPEP_0184499222 /NCGR_PEP_ID=MMETSP0113_2-20130426/40927_1 /TAXON_ID=91329 /ORGANISM="Norrisiella sphaerica, Strain BC52" /LENGTH=254 /DNA_ID=CAMNT_0026887057 /DNA_START=274 /DNA_END=1038 /DNA_ORIENTATION=+
MYTIKRKAKHEPMVPEKDVPGKGGAAAPNYISVCEPYDKPKAKKDPKAKKLNPWRGAKEFIPEKGTYLANDKGCFSRYEYIKQGYGHTQSYKDAGFAKEKKAAACLRGAPFGSKGASKRDEFHQHIAQLQWKELLEKEKKFDKKTREIQGKLNSESGAETVVSPSKAKNRTFAYDRAKGNLNAGGKQEKDFDNSWKSQTSTWIQKKGYGIKNIEKGSMQTSSGGYGNFDLNAIERPKHARVSVTKDFNDISHMS